MSQTSPRSSFSSRAIDLREKSSERPQFNTNSRVTEGVTSRADRRIVTNPTLTLSSAMDELSAANNKHGGTVSASATPHTLHNIPKGWHIQAAHICPRLVGDHPLAHWIISQSFLVPFPLHPLVAMAQHPTLRRPERRTRPIHRALVLALARKAPYKATRILLTRAICKYRCLVFLQVNMIKARHHLSRPKLDMTNPSK